MKHVTFFILRNQNLITKKKKERENTPPPPNIVIPPQKLTTFWENSFFPLHLLHSSSKQFSKTIKMLLVHPQMKILSSFTHPHVVPKLFEFPCSVKH